jgi:hypothetical protein
MPAVLEVAVGGPDDVPSRDVPGRADRPEGAGVDRVEGGVQVELGLDDAGQPAHALADLVGLG